jgi:hypothetical protein
MQSLFFNTWLFRHLVHLDTHTTTTSFVFEIPMYKSSPVKRRWISSYMHRKLANKIFRARYNVCRVYLLCVTQGSQWIKRASRLWVCITYTRRQPYACVINSANNEWPPCHVIHSGEQCDVISTCVDTVIYIRKLKYKSANIANSY